MGGESVRCHKFISMGRVHVKKLQCQEYIAGKDDKIEEYRRVDLSEQEIQN